MGEVIRLVNRRRSAAGARPRTAPASPPEEPLWREVVGRRLRDLRRARGQRLSDTAARAGMSPQYLSELERGRKDPSSEILAAAAGALGVPLREVVRLAHADLARGTGAHGPVLLAA
jgi:ribosome-binding protein aMBF1 (putative translation factor)